MPPVDTSVYVHFPWCAKKCPYCDFATRAIEPRLVPGEAYASAVLRELERRQGALSRRRLYSVFFGGGTPSLWKPTELARVLRAIREAFPSETRDLEVTVECNPSSLTDASALREAGVTRLSIGVQSLSDDRLKFFGRLHDAKRARAAIKHAQQAFERVSADLMFGAPGQTASDLDTEIKELLDRGLEHLSIYALTIEPGTQFGTLARMGRLPIASEDSYAEMFAAAEIACATYGLAHYEVSNYARPGAESRHNLHYWRGGAYLGLGAAAVGCLDQGTGAAHRYRNEADPEAYLVRADTAFEEDLGPQDIIREALMLGLRTNEGVDLRATSARAGVDARAGRQRSIDKHIQRGNLRLENHRLTIPQERWIALDGIVADLF